MSMQISVTGTEVLELEPEVISFTLTATKFYAPENMTWLDWLNYDYNYN